MLSGVARVGQGISLRTYLTIRSTRGLLIAIGMSLLSAPLPRAAGQEAAENEAPPPRRSKTPIPSEGFWPTQTLMTRVFERVNDGFAEHYEMDDEQKARALRVFRSRVLPFLEENRGELQRLSNQFYESVFNDRPPGAAEVAEWSQKVLPFVDELKEIVSGISTDMQEFMTDDQISKLDAEMAAFEAGMGMARNKIQSWADGNYDPDLEWPGPRMDLSPEQREEVKKKQQAERDAELEKWEARNKRFEEFERLEREREAASQAASAPARAITDEWELHTEAFIRRYDLDVDQQQRARAFLRAKQEERDEYLGRKSEELERVKRLGQDAKTAEQQKDAKEQFDRVNAPIERLFSQLKSKLDTIPTRAQRKKAAEQNSDGAAPAASSQPASPASGPAR